MNFSILTPVSTTPRNRTPVVSGTGVSVNIQSHIPLTVKGLNGFEIGTLMPFGTAQALQGRKHQFPQCGMDRV